MADRVSATAILRSPDGASILDAHEGITAETVSRYAAAAATVREATDRLRSLGFDVAQAGPTALSVSGDRSLFERVFGAGPGGSATAARVPSELQHLIAGITFPVRPTYFP